MASPMLYYLRHGETDWNAELRFQGQKDIPLNARGREQARENGRRLAAILTRPSELDFVASPLGRARETMEIVRSELGLAPHDYRIDDRLIEASYGDLEGTTLAEFKAMAPDEHRLRKQTRWTYRPRNGESHAMVLERILPFYRECRGNMLVCAHGVVGRAIRQHVLSLDPDEAADYTFPQDRVFVWRDGHETLI
ncbi:MAG: histidine phosphatase family protein [Nitratireductor sp.]